MLKQLILSYFGFGLLLGLYFLFGAVEIYLPIYLFNQLLFLCYGGIILHMYRNPHVFERESSLLSLVAVYTFFASFAINALSYHYTGNFFCFSEIDARLYDDLGIRLQFDPDAVRYITSTYNFDDWGAIFLTGIVYFFYESNLMLDVFYWVIGVLTAKYMYRLAGNFMPPTYAAMCTFAFVCSSYSMWFASTGLKETWMVFVIVYGYYAYLRYTRGEGLCWLISSLFVLSILIWFRPILLLFILCSFLLNTAFKVRIGIFQLTIVLVVVFVVIGFLPIQEQLSNYLGKRSVSEFIESQSDAERLRGSVLFTYSVNALSGILGSFPTFASETKASQYFWSSGLLFKLLLSIPFIFGVWSMFRVRFPNLNVLLLFPLLEAVGLIFILDALELRKSLPHYPMIYIVAFWFLSQQAHTKAFFKPIFVKRFSSLALAVLFVFIVLWNFRIN